MLHRGTRWVMRVSRLNHGDDEMGNDRLVKAFDSWGLTASPSRLSRWEYGNSRASYRLLRAYEDGCGLPPFLLFALNDRRTRYIDSAFADVASVEAIALLEADGIYAILDRAVTDMEVSGSDWYQLATFAASHHYFYLSHRNTAIVARRLIEELARSVGAGYILRFEALHLLASQPRMHSALVEQLTEILGDESTGTVGDAVSIVLRAAPSIRDELVAIMRKSESPMVSVSREWIADILRDRVPGRDQVVGHARVVPMAAGIGKMLPKWAMGHIECEMTVPLIGEALGGRSRLKRHEASLLLMLAGMQDYLSEPILDLFEVEGDPVLRLRLAQLLQYQVPAPEKDRLESLALAEENPEIGRSLWAARGHALAPISISGPVSAALADPRSEFGVSYALGISGSVKADLVACESLPAAVRGRLGWWHQHGPALLS